MFFKIQAVQEQTLDLLSALSEYQADLERGNYSTLDAYHSCWSVEEVWAVITDNLKTAANKQLLSAEEIAGFSSQLKKEQSVSFALIAQFLTSIYLLNIQKQAKPEDELGSLQKEQKVMLHVQAGIPGVCLAYLNAIECSLQSIKSKLSALSQVIISLEKNKEQFGGLSDLLIQISVQHWLALFEQLDAKLKINFITSKDNHLQRAANCLNIEEARKKLTIIEEYTLKMLEKLNNGIGKINIHPEGVVSQEPWQGPT